ncbi:splicing regulatory glutamine/lysine-rich protein 1 [Tetranychus urticae]|uniref:splicing regulatory glutamine/lysine-rich protein 1 n=1 Tax=Tetranychus urticae TaxID=32264 RepID=UPI00077C0977|nr:splicing regulatory glutamine/lysine-rich protein 1 [Tetranychus urticae]
MDQSDSEEIRRVVYVGNLDSSTTAEQLLTFFNRLGEVKYVRMADDEEQSTRFAFVEFTEQSSVANALQYNGVILGGRALEINHTNSAIVKQQAKSDEGAQKEIEEAMEPTYNDESEKMDSDEKKPETKDRSRSRSGSKSKTRDNIIFCVLI